MKIKNKVEWDCLNNTKNVFKFFFLSSYNKPLPIFTLVRSFIIYNQTLKKSYINLENKRTLFININLQKKSSLNEILLLKLLVVNPTFKS